MILCIWAAISFVAGWIWRLYHAIGDGRLFNYPVLLSRSVSIESAYVIYAIGIALALISLSLVFVADVLWEQ